MPKPLKQILFLVVFSFSSTNSMQIHSPKPQRRVCMESLLRYVDDEEKKENIFLEIKKELKILLNKKKIIEKGLIKARKAKVKLNIDVTLKAIREIKDSLLKICPILEAIQDNSDPCQRILNMYDELAEFLDAGLADYYL